MVEKAIGFIETDSVAAGIEAADAAVKTASIELLEARSICPGSSWSCSAATRARSATLSAQAS